MSVFHPSQMDQIIFDPLSIRCTEMEDVTQFGSELCHSGLKGGTVKVELTQRVQNLQISFFVKLVPYKKT